MKKSFLIMATLVAVFSCSKDTGNTNTQPPTGLFVNKKWEVNAISSKLSNGTLVTDGYARLQPYKKDDYWLFKPDLTFVYSDNQNWRPGATSDVFDVGTWKLNNSDLELTSTMGTNTSYLPAKVLELTSTSMKWESTDPSTGTVTWTTYTVIP